MQCAIDLDGAQYGAYIECNLINDNFVTLGALLYKQQHNIYIEPKSIKALHYQSDRSEFLFDLIKRKANGRIIAANGRILRNGPMRSSPITLIYRLIGAEHILPGCSRAWRSRIGTHCFRFPNFVVDYTVVNYTVLSQDVTIARNRIHAAVDRIELMRLETTTTKNGRPTYSNSSASQLQLDDVVCHIICLHPIADYPAHL